MITLTGQVRSTSHIYKYACRGNNPTMYMTTEGRTLKEAYQWEAKSQWKNKVLTGDIKLIVTFFHGDRRKRDIDNYNKLLLDALTGIVYEDDYQVSDLDLRRRYDKHNPRIEVEVLEI